VGSFVQVDAGDGVSCGLRPDGAAECWGSEEMEACDPVGEALTKIDAYDDIAVGLREDGTLVEWGPDYEESNEHLPGNYKDVSLGSHVMCVVKMDDSLEFNGSMLMNFTEEEGDYLVVSTNDDKICAITADSEVVCVREYEDGIQMPTGSFQKVIASNDYSCAHSIEGWMECWGGDGYGQSTFGNTHLWDGEVEPPPDSGNACEESEPNDVEYGEYPPWEEANDCAEMANGFDQADSIHGIIETIGEDWEGGETDTFRFVTSVGGSLVGSLEWESAYTDLDWLLYCYYGDDYNPWGWYALMETSDTAGWDKPTQGRSIITLPAGIECYAWIVGYRGDDLTAYTLRLWTEQ